MTITQIKSFLEVGKHLNYTLAANRLYISQSALSKQIINIEKELGVQLFRRNTRAVEFTPAGEILYDALLGIPEKYESGVERALNAHRWNGSMLRLGVLDGHLIDGVLEQRISQLLINYPELEINIEGASFRLLREGLRNGNFDMVITLGFDVEDLPELEYAVLEGHPTGVAVCKSLWNMRKTVVSLSELADEPFVVISGDESPRGYGDFIYECAKFGFEPNIVRTATTLESQLLCVEFGQGVALIDRATRLENSQNICFVDLEKPNIVNVVLSWNKEQLSNSRYLRYAVEALAQIDL